MFLEWWMIFAIGGFWVVSILSYGSTSFNQGAISVLERMQEIGYIQIDEDGEIIGLCNRDQENWNDSNQNNTNVDQEEEK
jgi:hypothetical protein